MAAAIFGLAFRNTFIVQGLTRWLRSFVPGPMTGNGWERLRSCFGALLGIVFTGLASRYILGPEGASPLLIAPMGASAVLLFAVPASPLAQPWSIIGGNLVSATIGVTAALYISDPFLAAAVAVAVSIGAMFALRCIHPPSGAVALTAVLGGPAIHNLGYGFVALPVGLNSFFLLLTALIFNNLARHRYPHVSQVVHTNIHRTADPKPGDRLGFVPADLDEVLKEYKELLDISRDDLENLFLQTEMHAYRRRFGDILCADIMSRDVIAVDPATDLQDAWTLLRRHRLKALPVIDNHSRHVVGVVTLEDFVKQIDQDRFDGFEARFNRLIRRTGWGRKHRPKSVGDIMTSSVQTARDDTHVVQLVPMLSDSGLHNIPIIDHERRLVGVVSQSDLIACLYRGRLAEPDNTHIEMLQNAGGGLWHEAEAHA
ncbi:MAG: HPP family protein [Rhodospirillaceae bacterium]|nr:MAG: HPP family protein [Rhodospirillaceae bacterium]